MKCRRAAIQQDATATAATDARIGPIVNMHHQRDCPWQSRLGGTSGVVNPASASGIDQNARADDTALASIVNTASS